ncbi:MAG TPA: PQQ-dependent sugar dehydrogenase [Gaiellaceae bacterium]
MSRPLAVALACLVLAAATGCDSGEQAEPAQPAPPASMSAETEPTPPGGRSLALVEVASGLDAPVHAAAAPGEPGRLYVVERAGRIRVLESGRVLPRPFLDISADVTSGGEQGLLSVAFHPDYAENGLFYVDYTDLEGDTRVVELRAEEGREPTKVRELLHVAQPYSNHNGGQLAFDRDGLLYVGMGDGGSGGDPENRAQDLGSRLGKLLRIDVDRPDADWEIVAYGLRNPWRFSFDRETGDLWIGDVGQGAVEEVDYLPAGDVGSLVNFGWDVFEGTHVYEDKKPNDAGRLVGPIAEYSHDEGCSITGGFVYRGEHVPSAQGRYFYGDYCSGRLWSLERTGDGARVRRLRFEVPELSSFAEDGSGELYLLTLDGTVYRLVSG